MKTFTYIENKIKQTLIDKGSTFSRLHSRYEFKEYIQDENISYEEEEIIAMIRDEFVTDVKTLYKLICNYFESKQLNQYLLQFKNEINPFFENDKKTLSRAMSAYDGEILSLVLIEISDFLSGFEFSEANETGYLLKRAGITYLENILENAAVIIHDSKVVPKNETQVYNAVKVVCKAVFPEANYPVTTFVTTAKEYKPDILIPYLNCAVEYKFATDEAKLKETIDQILIDVQGYSKHEIYKIFYAVFYVKPDIWGRQKFEKVWEEKGFPPNWKGKYIS